MKQWFSQYWHLVLLCAVCLAIMAIVFRFAAKAYGKYRKSYKAQEAEIKRLLALKERFVPLTQKAILESDDSQTLEGTALSIHLPLQKAENMEKEFSLLSKEKRYIYLLDVFVSDGSAAVFMKENGDILRMDICNALSLIGMEDFAEKFEPIRKMFDKNDVEVSYNESKIEEMDSFILQNDILSQIKLQGAKYIKNNYVAFVNK